MKIPIMIVVNKIFGCSILFKLSKSSKLGYVIINNYEFIKKV